MDIDEANAALSSGIMISTVSEEVAALRYELAWKQKEINALHRRTAQIAADTERKVHQMKLNHRDLRRRYRAARRSAKA